jgi:hypothetical protein
MLTTTTNIPEQLCPACGYEFCAATAFDDGVLPKEGSWTICVNCGAVLRLDANLRMVAGSIDDADAETAELLKAIVDRIKYLRARSEPPGTQHQGRSQ